MEPIRNVHNADNSYSLRPPFLFFFLWPTLQLQQFHIISPTPSSTPAVRSWARASGAHPSPFPEASSEHAYTYKKKGGEKAAPTTRRQDKVAVVTPQHWRSEREKKSHRNDICFIRPHGSQPFIIEEEGGVTGGSSPRWLASRGRLFHLHRSEAPPPYASS